MLKTKFISVDEINTSPGIKTPGDSDYISISTKFIEIVYPKPIPNRFRLIWSDRIDDNTLRNDNISYIHIYARQIESKWSVFIQKEAGWQSFVKLTEEAEHLFKFIADQRYAIEPKPR